MAVQLRVGSRSVADPCRRYEFLGAKMRDDAQDKGIIFGLTSVD